MVDWFAPGYKAGGIITSTVNFVNSFSSEFEIYVLTTDRDLMDNSPYENIITDKWVALSGRYKIFYCSPSNLSWRSILALIKDIRPDFIYLNSLFSRYFTIYPLLMRKIGVVKCNIILAPRGMLKESALKYKRLKKIIFINVVKLIRLHSGIKFQATDQTEFLDVKKNFGQNVNVSLVQDAAGVINEYPGSIFKASGVVSLLFIGRIHPIKNLDYLLLLLPKISGQIKLTIIGNEEDLEYAERCKEIIMQFKDNVNVSFSGALPNIKLITHIKAHHFLVLPTSGENFGHVIFEALILGKPVIISDQTPWLNLARNKAGWDLPLEKSDLFKEAIQKAVDIDQNGYDDISYGAWKFACNSVNITSFINDYKKLFS